MVLNSDVSQAVETVKAAPIEEEDPELKAALALSMEVEATSADTGEGGVAADDSVVASDSASKTPEDEERRKSCIRFMAELQKLFALLCLSHRSYVDPSDALHTLFKMGGSTLEIGVQEDVTEFNDMLLTALEDAAQGCYGKEMNMIEEFFFGKMEVHVKAEEADGTPCEQEAAVDKFSSILLQISSGDLVSALDALGQWEKMESFTTEKGHASTTAQQRTVYAHLPKVMIFPLQRLHFDRDLGAAVKLHDPFKFPDVLSFDGRLGQSSQAGEYMLLSVLMHRGKADSGHYWSFVKDGARWLQFNDTEVSEVTLETVVGQGTGSLDSEASASCLIYVKKDLIVGEGIDTNGSSVTLAQVLQDYVSEDDRKLEKEIAEWNERAEAEAAAADVDVVNASVVAECTDADSTSAMAVDTPEAPPANY